MDLSQVQLFNISGGVLLRSLISEMIQLFNNCFTSGGLKVTFSLRSSSTDEGGGGTPSVDPKINLKEP